MTDTKAYFFVICLKYVVLKQIHKFILEVQKNNMGQKMSDYPEHLTV